MVHTNWVELHRGLLEQTSMIVVACAVLVTSLRLAGRRLIAKSTRRAQPGRELLYRSTHWPLLASIMLCAAYLIGISINERIHARALTHVLEPSLHVGIIVLIAWAGWNLLAIYPRIHRPHSREIDPMIYDLVGRFARVGLLVLAGLLILRALHFPIASLLAVGGVVGIAIGFAAQGVVSNLVGALVVYMDKPFKIGEWIVLPEMNISGTVEDIGWRSTRLRGFDTSPFYVPNYVFNTHVVETPPRMQARRIQQTLPVRYADVDRLPAILKDLRAYIATHPGIDHAQSEIVNFTSYGTHSLDILIYCFAATVQWGQSLAVQEDVLLNAAQIIARHGGQLALPVTRVLMRTDRSERAADGNMTASQA